MSAERLLAELRGELWDRGELQKDLRRTLKWVIEAYTHRRSDLPEAIADALALLAAIDSAKGGE